MTGLCFIWYISQVQFCHRMVKRFCWILWNSVLVLMHIYIHSNIYIFMDIKSVIMLLFSDLVVSVEFLTPAAVVVRGNTLVSVIQCYFLLITRHHFCVDASYLRELLEVHSHFGQKNELIKGTVTKSNKSTRVVNF